VDKRVKINKVFAISISIVGLVLWVSSCKKNQGEPVSLLPERVESPGDATPSFRWGPDRPVNLTTQTLFVQLDYLPEPRVGAATIPTCIEWLPDDFALGFAQCEPNGERVEVFASQVRQSCLARETSQEPTEAEIGLDCSLADVFHYQFDPSLTFGVSGPTAQ